MESAIAKYIKLALQPVAVLAAEEAPEGALQNKEYTWNCVVTMLMAAARGRVCAFRKETAGCGGGAAGMGFQPYNVEKLKNYLSTGKEFYKQSPELAEVFLNKLVELYQEKLRLAGNDPYVLFKPLSAVSEQEKPWLVIFLANPDQLSGLVGLANYASAASDTVRVLFAAGCTQAILYPLTDPEHCYIGLTDPSARKFVRKDLLSFAMSFGKFRELEGLAAESFLKTETWEKIAARTV